MADRAVEDCIADYTGDKLDSVLCAIQAAWAYNRRATDYGVPQGVDPIEGWIVDPEMI